jgi:hypothetical protein
MILSLSHKLKLLMNECCKPRGGFYKQNIIRETFWLFELGTSVILSFWWEHVKMT